MKAPLSTKSPCIRLRASRCSAQHRSSNGYNSKRSRVAHDIAVLFVYLLFAVVSGVLFDCSCSKKNPMAGTVDDANSGALLGKLMTNGKQIGDTVTVCLFDEDTSAGLPKTASEKKEPMRTLISYNGMYEFDSLAAGNYGIEVTKDSIMVGKEHGIKLGRNEHKEVNITIVIIINQTFNIWTDQSQNMTINNFYIDNGKVEKADSGYVLSFAQTDTLVFKIEANKNSQTIILRARIIRHPDGTTTFDIIDAPEGVVITPGPIGYLGAVTISIKEPGTITIESSFDTSGAPRRSE
jgi:hypothetical protein